ncbi:hypothetical protein THIOSC13_1280003 [uncultured Thiomicrorhabdus sp.]
MAKNIRKICDRALSVDIKQARSAIKECVGAINWLHEEVDALMDKVEKNTTRETLLQHFKALIVRALKDFE